MFTRHFFVEGKYLGSRGLRPVWKPNVTVPVPPRGHCFFCAACSRLWAECPVDDQPSHVHEMLCAKHESTDQIGGYGPRRVGIYSIPNYAPAGTLYLPGEYDFPLETFPEALLFREILLHLPWLARVRYDLRDQALSLYNLLQESAMR